MTPRLGLVSRGPGHCGSPGFLTPSQHRLSPGRGWALSSVRRTVHPGGRVLRRSSQSLRHHRKGGGESLGLWGAGGGLWAGLQKALSFSTSQHWACTLVLCVPISGLFLASPLCQDLGQLYLETLSHRLPCQRMGDPHGTPVPLRWSNCRSWAPLFHPALEVPQLSPDAWGG